MTSTTIRAVAFDLGGTLEHVYYDDALRLEAAAGLRELLAGHGLDPGLAVPELLAAVTNGMAAYRAWREVELIELAPERVWADYVLPNHGLDRGRLEAVAEDLALYYETQFFKRTMRPEVPQVLARLRTHGLRLAVISNIISRRLVPHRLQEYGIARYFDPVISSCVLGLRKPNPRIFLEAARLMGLEPAACAYVGDTISRDVAGSQQAGYGLAIQIKSFLTSVSDTAKDVAQPDAVVNDLTEVVDLVLARGGDGD
ncbi:MAG TPA: HAD-IA family hydrolase [Anaerolineae bacterium]|nr:HAD-IA family hydrolase [Anaerolineae bacterium]HOQ97490.1 HAD-IA family hydrolase [Anaerolineae bacterium]HPL28573.1 HAD-IA family hydrolase [Anaerolineae bacterium]